jgi:putative membrane protein
MLMQLMSEREFFEKQARTKVREAVEAVEAQTSAELVVAVRRQSSHYRHVDVALGSLSAFIVLLLLLFLPWPFDVNWMPVEVALSFSVGMAVSSTFWTLKRWLVRDRCLREATWRAACTLFHEKGISRTSGRNGILVLVSMLERRVEIVTDIGIDVDALGPGWTEALGKIRGAVGAKPDFDRFVQALVELGPALGVLMPRAEDDVNELPDEPDVS